MLKTGVMSKIYFGADDYENGLERLKKHGYDCVDYEEIAEPNSALYGLSDRDFERYFKQFSLCAEKNGVEVFQMHGLWPTIDDATAEGREKNVQYFLKQIRAAQITRCKHLVIHPCMPYGWGDEPCKEKAFECTKETLEKLLPSAKEAGVILCVENMPFAYKGHSFSEIGELKRLIRSFDDPNVKACFDTGHANVTGENPYDCLTTLGEDLAVLHVHDDKRRSDMHMIPFTGEIDWSGFVRGLKEIGYKGCISLETVLPSGIPEPLREKMQHVLAETAKWFAAQL